MSESLRFLPVYNRAKVFARRAHFGQVRKYTGEPYFNHLEEVANIIHTDHPDQAMIAAAYLHDTIEDTDTTLDQIRDLFGPYIASLVWWLTDQSKPSDGNRAARKKIDREHIAAAPGAAQTIKYADLISNTRYIVKHDPDFAKVYLPEKLLLLEAATKGDLTLHTMATKMANQLSARLENQALQKALAPAHAQGRDVPR